MKKMLSRLFSKIIFQLTPSSTLHGTSQETLIPLDSLNFLPAGSYLPVLFFLMHYPLDDCNITLYHKFIMNSVILNNNSFLSLHTSTYT